jgi:hypothetical protein
VGRAAVGVHRVQRPIAVAVALEEDSPLRGTASAATGAEHRGTGGDEDREERRPDQDGSVEPLP